MDPLEELIEPMSLSISLAVLGLVVGSFLNVVIYRLPKMMEAQWQRDYANSVVKYIKRRKSSPRARGRAVHIAMRG